MISRTSSNSKVIDDCCKEAAGDVIDQIAKLNHINKKKIQFKNYYKKISGESKEAAFHVNNLSQIFDEFEDSAKKRHHRLLSRGYFIPTWGLLKSNPSANDYRQWMQQYGIDKKNVKKINSGKYTVIYFPKEFLEKETGTYMDSKGIHTKKFTSNKAAGDVIDQIAKLTDRNNHSEACILGAKFLKNKMLEKIFEGIKMIHEAERSLPHQIIDYRYEKSKELWKLAEQKLSKEEADRFKGAF